jgi:hypothetical protein
MVFLWLGDFSVNDFAESGVLTSRLFCAMLPDEATKKASIKTILNDAFKLRIINDYVLDNTKEKFIYKSKNTRQIYIPCSELLNSPLPYNIILIL